MENKVCFRINYYYVSVSTITMFPYQLLLWFRINDYYSSVSTITMALSTITMGPHPRNPGRCRVRGDGEQGGPNCAPKLKSQKLIVKQDWDFLSCRDPFCGVSVTVNRRYSRAVFEPPHRASGWLGQAAPGRCQVREDGEQGALLYSRYRS